jgi:hypothetical protein
MNHVIHLGLLLASTVCLSYLFSCLLPLAWGRFPSFAAGAIIVVLVNNVIVNGGFERALVEAGLILDVHAETRRAVAVPAPVPVPADENKDKEPVVKIKKPVVDDRRINSKSRRRRELKARRGN